MYGNVACILTTRFVVVIVAFVIKHHEPNDEQEEQPVSSVTTTTEPATGDKRPREDESTDQNPNQPPAARPSPTPQASASQMNGNYGSAAAAMQGVNGGMGVGYDALYIGDLQWVCLSCRLAPHVHYFLRHVSVIPSPWDLFLFAVDD